MKNYQNISYAVLFAISMLFSSCSVVEGIFKAGMGFGIFIVVAIVVFIGYIIMRMGKSKNS